jgi:glycosyltransferase involved in cell wall biosynthesis
MNDNTRKAAVPARLPAISADCARKISIIIPVYNRLKLLERAVASVREQIYSDWELLIIDDGSTDGTAEYAASLAAADPRIICLRNSHKNGPGGARNEGMLRARGGFIAFLDSDDYWLPAKLATQMAYFDHNPAAMVVGTDLYLGSVTESARLAQRYPKIDNSPQSVFAAIIEKKQFWMYTTTVMLRRSAFDQIALFDETLIRCEDLVMWLAINELFGWHYIPEPLAVANVNPARNADYSKSRHVPEGYYHMLFVRDVEQHATLDADMKKALRRQRRDSDYLFWRGRDRLQKKDPRGFFYYGASIGARAWEKLARR